MAQHLSPSERHLLAKSVRGNGECKACMRCRAALVRPEDEGRHTVACGVCGEQHIVVVIDDRMIIAGLTEGQKVRLAKKFAWAMLLIVLLAGGIFVAQSMLEQQHLDSVK